MAGSHSTRTPLSTLTILRLLQVALRACVGRVGGDEVEEHHQEEEEDAEEVGGHGQLHVRDHGEGQEREKHNHNFFRSGRRSLSLGVW